MLVGRLEPGSSSMAIPPLKTDEFLASFALAYFILMSIVD